MKKILIANIFGVGDVLFTTPLIANLQKEISGASIDYLCNARTRAVAESNPDIDRVFVYEKDDFLALWKNSKPAFFSALGRLFGEIRRGNYDAVFDFTLSREFGFAFLLAGIRERIGLDYRNRGIFLTRKRKFEGFQDKHVIEYYLDLLGLVGMKVSIREMRIVLDEDLRQWAVDYLGDKNAGEGRVVAVIPGGGASWGVSSSRKRWSADGFARAADALTTENSGAVAILGDSSEKGLCDEVAGKMTASPLFVETGLSLEKYMALLSKCDLAVCNDGGPLHIAAALGLKTVSIFGPVDEKVYGPYPPSATHKVLVSGETDCRPCYRRFKLPECKYDNHCLAGIAPEAVIDECLKLLEKGNKTVRSSQKEI